MTTVRNFTRNTIVLINVDGTETTLPSVGIADVTTTPGVLELVPGILVPVATAPTHGPVVGLPDPEPGVMLIVSSVVGQALRGSRPDVLVPGTGPNDAPRRNTAGQITGITRLNRTA